ncbi:hypothetical protein BGZ54_001265, partial [Gamsiella multidivaricata]
MQVLPRVNGEIIAEPHLQQLQQQQDNRVTFQIPPGSPSISTPPQPQQTTAFAVVEEPVDDSDTETPIGWNGVTREPIQEGQVLKAGYLMKKGERLK